LGCYPSLVATWAVAQIKVEGADTVWKASSDSPEVNLGTIEYRFIIEEANTVYRDTLTEIPSTLKDRLSNISSQIFIGNANTTFYLSLTPFNRAIGNLNAMPDQTSIDLKWTKLRADEFPNTLIVYSQERLTWRPETGVDYTVGDVIDEKVVVGFVGNADHATTPLTIDNLNSGVEYHFTAFPFDADKNYDLGAYVTAETTGETATSFKAGVTLTQGVNMISLPLKPDVPFTAPSLADAIDATFVIRMVDGHFDAYVHAVRRGEEFPIEMGKGYIVNVIRAQTFGVTGQAWGEPVAAPSVSPTDPWAFVITGQVEGAIPMGGYLRIINHRTGKRLDTPLSSSGEFVATFVDMSRHPVVEVGDEIVTQLIDESGIPLTGTSQRHVLRQADLANAYLLTHLKVIPEKTRLLQNYPNPFNPETWIPFQLARDGHVTFEIYNLSGHLVQRIELGHSPAGWYISRERAAYWDGRNAVGERISSGAYWVVMKTETFSETRQIIVLK